MLVFATVQLLPGDLGSHDSRPIRERGAGGGAERAPRRGRSCAGPLRGLALALRARRLGHVGGAAPAGETARARPARQLARCSPLYALVARRPGRRRARHGSPRAAAADRSTPRVSATAVSLLAMPEFVVGTILSIVFAVELGLVSRLGGGSGRRPVAAPRADAARGACSRSSLFGSLARVARAATLTALDADYTRTATLKGLSAAPRPRPSRAAERAAADDRRDRGARRATSSAALVVVETLFSYPGLGKLLLDSATAHDLAPARGVRAGDCGRGDGRQPRCRRRRVGARPAPPPGGP